VGGERRGDGTGERCWKLRSKSKKLDIDDYPLALIGSRPR
jgi:hypothetical protein